MPLDRSRVAARFAATIAELQRDAQAFKVPGGLDPFVLRVGPDLLRRPWLAQYFDRTMLRGIYAAMRGREKLYGQMRDFLDLLQLQRTPPTLEEQRQESARLSQYYRVPISEQDITWMTDDEAAIARLSSFVFPDAPLPEARFVQWHVPLVLSTVRKPHTIQVKDGRRVERVVRIPTLLQPEGFLCWFKERLLLAVEARLKYCWGNPLWLLPDGKLEGYQVATDPDLVAFSKMRPYICRGGRVTGPRLGSRHMSAAEFRQRYPEVYQLLLDAYGSKPHRKEVAEALNMDTKTFRGHLNENNLPFPPF